MVGFALTEAGAQLRVVNKPVVVGKPSVTRFGVGFGRARSVLFLTRNIKEDNDARGWQTVMSYGLNRVLRATVEFSWFNSIDIAPTWKDVNAHAFEANIHFLSSMPNGTTRFFPLAGLSYNVFKGHFTGLQDHLNLRALYAPGTYVRTPWFGANIGCGSEHDLLKMLSVYGEFKMRVGVSEGYNQLSIMDVFLSAGVRYTIRVPAPHKLFSSTRSRYLLRVTNPDE